jgi:hypothetical protein
MFSKKIFTSLSILRMFALFRDPLYYSPTYWFQQPRFIRPQFLFERYLDALDQRFFSMLTADAAELLGLESQAKQKSESRTVSSSTIPTNPPSPVDPAPTTASDAAASPPSAQSGQATDSASAQKALGQLFGRQYVSQTTTAFNGQDYVEEHREKVTGSNGETRIATRRRLGDRWYENEIHIDKDGNKTERETWHNVADDDIEKFKLEWAEKRGPKGQMESDAAQPQPQASALESGEKSGESHE